MKSTTNSKDVAKKPRMFIASAQEGLDVARAVQSELEDVLDCEIWRGAFPPSESTLNYLIEAARRADFAVVILTNDGTFRGNRDQSSPASRPNPILELGLFIGIVGEKRTFALVQNDPKPFLPSDIAGITHLSFALNEGDLRRNVGPPCTSIRDVVRRHGQRKGRSITCVPLSEQEDNRDRKRVMKYIKDCKAGDTIRFVSITSKWLIEPKTFISENGSVIETALSAGVRIKGILLDPASDAAKMRSRIQSPRVRRQDRAMLFRNSSYVRERLSELSMEFPKLLAVRYASVWMTFQLWLFEALAMVEPYHVGQLETERPEAALCGFTRLLVPRSTREYQVLVSHFDALWVDASPYTRSTRGTLDNVSMH